MTAPGGDRDAKARAQQRRQQGRRRLGLAALSAGAGLATVAVVGVHLGSAAGHAHDRADVPISVTSPSHTPRPVVPFKVLGPDGQATYAAVGVHTVPVTTPDPPPRISKEEVVRRVSSGKTAPPNGATRPPDSVSLVDYTSTGGDGATRPPVRVWAVEYDDVTQAMSYPALYSGPTGLVSGWTVMVFLDATTGRFVDSFDYT